MASHFMEIVEVGCVVDNRVYAETNCAVALQVVVFLIQQFDFIGIASPDCRISGQIRGVHAVRLQR